MRYCTRLPGLAGQIVFFFVLMSLTKSYAQSSFDFLDKPGTARLDALGGENVSTADEDVNSLYTNPALVGDSLSNFSAANLKFFPAGVSQSSIAYARSFDRVGMVLFGINRVNYGSIDSYDETGAYVGTYKAGETSIVVGKSHTIGNFRLGATMDAAFSSISGYHATALAFNLGGVFVHPNEDLQVGLLLENAGFILKEYSETSSSQLPTDVKAGITYKPTHMPARFIFTAYQIVPQRRDTLNMRSGQPLTSLDKAFGHLNVGMELLIHRNFNILVGYNFLRHQQLSLEEGSGLSGFSVGLNGRVNSFEFVLARSSYFAGQAGYSFSIAVNWDDIIR